MNVSKGEERRKKNDIRNVLGWKWQHLKSKVQHCFLYSSCMSLAVKGGYQMLCAE